MSEEGGRVSSEGSFTDCTHYAFLDKTWSWRLGTIGKIMRDQGIIKFWLKGRSDNEKSIFHQTFKISLLQIWLIWGFQERRIFFPRILRRVLDTGSCHQWYWYTCQNYSLICLGLKRMKLYLFGLTDNLLDFIHWPSLTYLRFIQWNPDITTRYVPGITINNVPTKVTVKCMWENPDVTIFDITLFPISRWEFSGPNVK